MKTKRTTLLLALTAGLAFGHEGIELGPNQGRVLELSDNESVHGEVTEREGELHVAVLGKDLEPLKVESQTLVAIAGTREKPVKLEVAKDANGFTLPLPGADEWLILRFRADPAAKTVTARLHYNTGNCQPCGRPEWRCACGDKE